MFKAHFASFCTGDNQACSYEDWIDALTSSRQRNNNDGRDASSNNASASTTSTASSAPTDILLDFEGMVAKVIDPRYYQEDCEERRFWNEKAVEVAGSGRTEVAARRQQSDESLTADGSSSSSAMADFMPPVIDTVSAEATKEVAGDLLSFD